MVVGRVDASMDERLINFNLLLLIKRIAFLGIFGIIYSSQIFSSLFFDYFHCKLTFMENKWHMLCYLWFCCNSIFACDFFVDDYDCLIHEMNFRVNFCQRENIWFGWLHVLQWSDFVCIMEFHYMRTDTNIT